MGQMGNTSRLLKARGSLQNRALYEEGHLPVGADKCPIVIPSCSCRDKGSAGGKYEVGLEQGRQVEPKIAKYKSGSYLEPLLYFRAS